MIHSLKIAPSYFEAVKSNRKTFELRKNDRNYKIDDELLLQEFNGDYTGRTIKVKITYILEGGIYGLDKDYVILAIKKVE